MAFTDIDGNSYDTVVINGFEYSSKPLRTTRYANGTAVPAFTPNPVADAYRYVSDSTDPVYQAKWGALYNQAAVASVNGLAPTGWHVPSQAEWQALFDYLIANGYNWDNTTTGNKIGKACASQSDWTGAGVAGRVGNDQPSNNESGLSIFPAGISFAAGSFYGIGGEARVASSTSGQAVLISNGTETVTIEGMSDSWLKSVYVMRTAPTGSEITVNNSGRGSTSPSGAQVVPEGDDLEITAIDSDAYGTFDHWEATGTLVLANENARTTTVVNPTEDGTVTAFFVLPNTVKFIKMTGQSNTEGRDNDSGYTSTTSQIKGWNGSNFVNWADPTITNAATYMPAFGNAIIAAGFTGTILAIECAEGGIGISSPSDNKWSDPTDTVNTNSDAKVLAANVPISAIFYYGSEQDTASTKSAYKSEFITYAANERLKYGNIPIFVVNMDYPNAGIVADIRAANLELQSEITDFYVVADALGVGLKPGDPVHITRAGEDNIGGQIAANENVLSFFGINSNTITVTSGANGTVSPDGAVDVDEGDDLVLTVTPANGYKIDEITLSSGLTQSLVGDQLTIGGIIADGTVDITFAALYNYTVTFNQNNATTPSDPITDSVVEPDTTLGTLPTPPQRTGYNFAGWYTALSGGTQVTALTVITGNITVYARWTVIDYTINYTLNGGTNNGSNPATYNIESGTITFLSPSRTGYNPSAWSVLSIPAGSTGNVSTAVTWSLINYNITYNLDGGQNSGNNPATYNIESAEIVFDDPTKTGYDPSSWSVPSIPSGSIGNVTTTVTWTPIEYSITYLGLEDGANDPLNPATYNIEDAEITFGAPTRSGFTPSAWSTPVIASGSTGNVSTSVTWTPVAVDTYNVTYNGNGNTGGTAPTDGSDYEAGDSVTVANAGTLTRTGYTATGYNTAANGTGTARAFGSTFSMPAANVTLFIQWTLDTGEFTLEYTAETGGTLDGNETQLVESGESGTPVTAVPDSGMVFSRWSDNSTANPRTDTNVQNNISVSAIFATDPNSIYRDLEYRAFAGGSITGNANQSILNGQTSTAVTAIAETGYTFQGWDDGLTTATRTDTANGNVKVFACFMPDNPATGGIYYYE